MSTTVDQRVVEMRFDNKQFENNVQTSLSTLDKLKQSLNLTGASKGLENVSSAAKKCDMSGLSSAVQTVKARFSALEVVAVTSLANIANSAVNAGKRMISSLTIDPVKDGFKEYELVLGAVQTTMAGTGKTAEQVEEQLKRLDDYADDTVYSTADMLNNLPKFTNAGVELEKATTAMIGIANATALAGGDASKASIAFYNLGQSIGTGYLTRMDYNSINNAGIATMEWKNQMIAAAVAQGKLTKTGEDSYAIGKKTFTLQSLFIDGLQEQWASTDVLMSVFEDYGDTTTEIGKKAQSSAQDIKHFTMMMDSLKATAGTGWKDTWQLVFGGLDEAKELWTGLGNAISKIITVSADARNEMLKGWKDLGGRTDVIEAFKNAFAGVMSIVKPVSEAFKEIFPPMTAERLFNITEGLKELTAHFKLSDTASANLKSTFKGLFAVLDIVKQAFTAVFKAVTPIAGEFWSELGGGILEVTATWGDWLVKLRDTIETTGIFNNVMQGVASFVKAAKNAIGEFIKVIKENIVFPGFEILHSFLERLHERLSGIGQAAGGMKTGVTTAVDEMGKSLVGSKFLQWFGALWEGVKIVAGGIVSALGALTSGIAEKLGQADFKGILDIVNSLIGGGIGVAIIKFIDRVGKPVKGLTDILNSVKDCFKALQTELKAGALLKIATAIGILAASIVVISLIDSVKLAASLGAITVLFAELMGSMTIFGKISGNLKGVAKTCAMMIGISVAVLLLASALKKIGGLDWDQIAKGLVGVVGLTATMIATAKIMGSGSSTIIKGAAQMAIFAVAIKILASACKDLSSLDWNELGKGLVGVGALMAEIVLFLNTAKFSGKAMTTAAGVAILAVAIKVLASACKDFGGIPWHELTKGLAGMAGALIAVTTAVNFMPKNMVSIGVGLVAVSAALVIMASAIGKFGKMQWDEIGRGLAVLGGTMAILAVGLNVMKGTLGGSAALVVAVAALAVLTPVLSILGAMSWEGIAKGLVAIAGAFTIIGIAGLVLTPLIGTILGLSAAFALIGLGVLGIGAGLLAAGAGLSALAVGFTALAAAGAAGATAIVASLTVVITGIASLIPLVIEKIGEGLIAFCTVIADGSLAIAEAVTAVLLAVIDAIVTVTPKIIDAVVVILETLLRTLADHIPSIVQAGFDILLGFLRGIRDNIGEVIRVAIQVITAFIGGVAGEIPNIIQSAFDLIIAFIDGLGVAIEENTPRLVKSVIGLGGHIIQGLVDGLFAGIKKVKDCIVDVGKSMLNGLKDFLGIKSPSRVMRDEVGYYIVEGLAEGITENMSAEEAATKKAQNIVSAFKAELDKFSLDTSTTELEYQLWEKLNGATATDAEKSAAQMSLLSRKLMIQTENVALAQAEYKTTTEAFGAASEEAQEAYNKYLKSQIDLAELSSQLTEERSVETQRQTDAQHAYYDYIRENANKMLALGLTMEDVQKAASSKTGFDPNAVIKGMSADVQGAVGGAMGTVQNAYASNAQQTFGGLVTNFSDWGMTYAGALGEGLQNGTPKALEATTALVQATANGISSQKITWQTAAISLVDGFVLGIGSQVQSAAQAATTMAEAALTAAKETFKINSPSKAFAEIGMYADMGLAKGLTRYANMATEAASEVGKKAITGLSSTISKISSALDESIDSQPTIRPVLDLSAVRNGAGRLNTLFTRSQALSVSASMNNAPKEVRQNGETSATGESKFEFVQNNYSPKALSRLDIYRQTKNQFSQLKGVVRPNG